MPGGFCGVLHKVQTKHCFNPSRCYKFVSRKIGKYKRIQQDKFLFVSHGNEDWNRRRKTKKKDEGEGPIIIKPWVRDRK